MFPLVTIGRRASCPGPSGRCCHAITVGDVKYHTPLDRFSKLGGLQSRGEWRCRKTGGVATVSSRAFRKLVVRLSHLVRRGGSRALKIGPTGCDALYVTQGILPSSFKHSATMAVVPHIPLFGKAAVVYFLFFYFLNHFRNSALRTRESPDQVLDQCRADEGSVGGSP